MTQEQGDPLRGRAATADAAEPVVSGKAGIPIAELVALENAARKLLAACQLADANEDLSEFVDGSIMDELSEALLWRYPIIWTDEQVAKLNESQEGYGHPFTCGGNRTDEAHRAYAEENGGDWGQLVAGRRGWFCPVCDYRQTLAHDWQFNGAQPNPFAQGTEAGTAATTGAVHDGPVGIADAP